MIPDDRGAKSTLPKEVVRDAIINFTPTGLIPTREMTPHVPITPGEIIQAVEEAVEIGITMVHVHARDPRTGLPTQQSEIYQEIIEGIREVSDELVVCVSLSGRMLSDVRQRAQPLALQGRAKPDMGSLTLSSVNFNRQASINEPETIMALAEEMRMRGILPELEAFDLGMLNYAGYLVRKGLLDPPHYINLILGNVSCAQVDILHIGVMLRDLPAHTLWSMGGIGGAQIIANSVAIACGGGARVGLEDNIWYDSQRTRLARNGELVRRIHVLAAANERSVMRPSDLRRHLGLEPGHGRYGRCAAQKRSAGG